ncbi:MAG: hypothetical protein JWQ09_5177 [Segetibacter sp.]|nr:hypothetical protein [Segetibacter sp.]
MIDLNKKIRCFISSSSEDLEKANKIRQFLEKEGVDVQTLQNSFFPGLTVVENLQNVASKVDFVIFLLPSDNGKINQLNANLFFEMGLISGMGKPFLLLIDENSDTRLPSDLSSIMYLRYEPQNIESSFRFIRNWAAHSFENSI